MISGTQCWLKSCCKKYQSGDNSCDTENSYCIKLFKLDKLYEDALLPTPMRKKRTLVYDYNGTDKDKFVLLHNYEVDIETNVKQGRNLYIHSSTCGNGKSSWAIRMLQQYFNAIWYKCDLTCKALFISTPRYLLSLKDNISNSNDYAQHINKHVYDADLVVWDDIATKTATDFEKEHLLSIIDARLQSGKANIFTSNIATKDVSEIMGPRLASRIVNNSVDVEFFGQDKRALNLEVN